jgi:ribosomal peptide maturation radical SAM protein 1
VQVVHANLDYVDWINARAEFTFTNYQYYALVKHNDGWGDWIFSAALYDDPSWRCAEFRERSRSLMNDAERSMTLALHELAVPFISDLVERIVRLEPDVVGFTTSVQQNLAALAAAKRIKELAPRTVTVFGGANCDGVQGEALHRNFDFVDFVVRGEGEVVFAQLLDALHRAEPVSAIRGLCWRTGSSAPVVNPPSTGPLPPAAVVPPDYDGYLERLSESVARDWFEPMLVVEGSRGCWWGEKHHCTFCGLNGSSMQFRGKSPERFFDEVMHLIKRHQVLDFSIADNILDMNYLKTVLPRVADLGYNVRFHCEIKSNMRREQLAVLARAGVLSVQPGIENLDSHVLKLMDKGVSGCQNVRLLRDTRSLGMAVYWSYLYGFPGETDEDYLAKISQLPALYHLPPPLGISRVMLERFSPHFDRPEFGFTERRAVASYWLNYDLPPHELDDLAYAFDSPHQGIGEPLAEQLGAATGAWEADHLGSRLTYCDLGTSIVLANKRSRYAWTAASVEDPVEVAAFRLLDQPHTPAGLTRDLGRQGYSAAADVVASLLDKWQDLGLLFHDAGQFLHVATTAANQGLLDIAPEYSFAGELSGELEMA